MKTRDIIDIAMMNWQPPPSARAASALLPAAGHAVKARAYATELSV